jgi:hypothetical protein
MLTGALEGIPIGQDSLKNKPFSLSPSSALTCRRNGGGNPPKSFPKRKILKKERSFSLEKAKNQRRTMGKRN